MAGNNEDVQVIFGGQIAGVIEAVEGVKDQLNTLAAAGEGVTEAFTGIGEAVAAAFALEKIDQFVEKIGDLGLQVERTSQQLGLTTEQVSLLNYAAETNDVSTSQMRNSLERLTVGIEAAANGAGRQAAAFKLLSGETAQEFIASGGKMEDAIQRIAQHTAELGPHANLAGAYIALMGRSGADAIPVFRALGLDVEGLRDKVRDAGLVMSTEFTAKIAETREANIDLKESVSGLGVSMFSILKPAIDGILLGLRGFVQSLQESMQYGGLLWGVLEGITGGFLILETVVLAVADVVKTVFQVIEGLGNATLQYVQAVTQGAWDAVHGNFSKVKEDWQAAGQRANQIFKDVGAQLDRDNNDTLQKMKKSWSEYWTDITTQAQTNQVKIKNSFAQGTGSSIVGLDDEKKKMDEDIQLQKSYLDLALAQAGENLEKKKQLWEGYFQWLKAKYPEDVKDQNEAAKQEQNIVNQQVKQQEQAWDKFFGDFNQGLNGMLRHTSTWQQATSNIFWKVVGTFETMVEKQLAKWIVKETTQTAATTTGNAARLASDTATAATGSAVQAAASGKTIMADAAKAYGGTYAFLAPAMGPFAAIPAGAAFAAVAAFEGLASFDVGSWNIPYDQVAMVHQGERIMTAEENRSFSANAAAGGGGMQIHFNGPVYGMNDFKQAVARAVQQSSREFNPNLIKAIKT